MTEYQRPGQLGTTEHDSVGEFSKTRLYQPSHSFIGKGQAPAPLGTHSNDEESRRLTKRYPAPAHSLPSDSSRSTASLLTSTSGASTQSARSAAPGSQPQGGNVPSPGPQRIADTYEHVRAWLRAALSNASEHQTQGLWLAARREEGLDRYDNNLAAAERFAMAAEGFWNVLYSSKAKAMAGNYLLRQGRMKATDAQAGFGKVGSDSSELTEKWGQLGHPYHQLGMTAQTACEAAMTHRFSRK